MTETHEIGFMAICSCVCTPLSGKCALQKKQRIPLYPRGGKKIGKWQVTCVSQDHCLPAQRCANTDWISNRAVEKAATRQERMNTDGDTPNFGASKSLQAFTATQLSSRILRVRFFTLVSSSSISLSLNTFMVSLLVASTPPAASSPLFCALHLCGNQAPGASRT